MTEAVGIHAHPNLKLGKRPPIPGRKSVKASAFFTALPDHPLVDVAPSLNYPMDHNDEVGDCVVAALDHFLQVVCSSLGVNYSNWGDDKLLRYYQSQNPNFRSWSDGGSSRDQGMIIQTFLEFLVGEGDILAFGQLDHTNLDELRAAAYIGLGIVTGEELQVAQQSQTTWDYKRSGDWGGHCTVTVGYANGRQTCVTWGSLVDMTEAFISHQLDEAWFVLTKAHVDHPEFRNHFDLNGFAAAVSDLTNGKVVVPVTPLPTPTPSPEAASFPGADPDVDTHIVRAAARAHKTVTDWLNHHFDTYFKL